MRKFHAAMSLVGLLAAAPESASASREEAETNACIPPSLFVPPTATVHAPQLVIAHRGASAHFPEHTLPAYRLALEMGADYFEPDLVATKDDELVAIHSMDLDVTTDVAVKFPDRVTFSEFLNRTGYWSFEFTLAEIKTLRVKQRLPEARSTAFDGLFGVPDLTEILELLHYWNAEVEGKREKSDGDVTQDPSIPSHPQPGVYLELKDSAWLTADTDKNLVDLFFNHIEKHSDLWHYEVLPRMCPTKIQKIHEYRIPPVVIQSFDVEVLKEFSMRWKSKFHGQDDTPDIPAPPTVLLVSRNHCLEESFWYQLGGQYREYVSGIGPDKACLFSQWREFMGEAIKFNLAVHPWTERPETKFIGTDGTDAGEPPMTFDSTLDEIKYLFCTVKVHGVFSESVQVALIAANIGCEDDKKDRPEPPVQPDPNNIPANTNSSSGGKICYETDKEANSYIGIASFIMGAFIASMGALWLNRDHQRRGRRQLRIPTVELTEDELEMI